MKTTQTQAVRVLSAQGSKLVTKASASKAPAPVVGAGVKCCCEFQ